MRIVVDEKERLEKIDDYTTYELSYEPQKRCQLKEKFVFEDKTFYFDCVDEVYLSYGSTKMTLEEALKNKYLTFDDLKNGLLEEETDEEIFFDVIVRSVVSSVLFRGANCMYKNVIIKNNYDFSAFEKLKILRL